MTIVLLILKIIGIVLLVILGLILFLVLLVLFVPVCYRASGSLHNNQAIAKVRVSWLFCLVVFALDQTPEKSGSYLRIFGIRMKPKNVDNQEGFAENIEEEPPEKQADSKAGKDSEPAEKPESGTGAGKEPETGKEPQSDIDTGKESETDTETGKEPESGAESGSGSKPEKESGSDSKLGRHHKSDTKPEKKSGSGKKANIFMKISDKIRGIRQKIRDILQRIKQAVRKIEDTITKIRTILEDEHFRPAAAFLGGKAGRLLRRVFPKKFRLTLRFSTGSPDTTGEALGVIAMFPQAYKYRWSITPDFTAEKAYAEADFDVRGRIFLFHMAGMLIAVLRNKDCRGLYKTIKNIF